jgi:VWFA-related protein
MPSTLEADAGRRILRCFGSHLGLLLLLYFCSPLFPQSNKEKKVASPGQSVYSVRVNAVVVNATVTDKAGNPVTDLRSSDFKVYDDGEPQSIQTFALESIDPPELEETKIPGPSPKREETKVPGSPPKRVAKEPNAPEPRLISIVIDDLTMEPPGEGGNMRPGSIEDFPRMIDAVKKFVKNDVSPMDQVSILSGSRKVQFPFSDNKQRLFEELDTIGGKLNVSWAFRYMSDLEARVISGSQYSDLPFVDTVTADLKKLEAKRQNADLEFRTRNLLNTIRQNIRTLRHFEGVKMVVLFSDGFLSETGTAEAYQLQELVNLALHSGIILNSVSTRGISSDLGSPAPIATDMFDRGAQKGRALAQLVTPELDQAAQEKPLAQIASETGGQFFPRGNNMYLGLRNIARRRSAYYIFTYGMPPHNADGAYHRIKLEVTRPGLELSYRKGYYTPKEEMMFENSKKEDLIEALSAPGDMNQIPMTLSYNYSQEDDYTYAVSFTTHVNIRGLQFAEEEARRKNQVSLVLVAFDEADRYISGLEKTIDFQLLEGSYVGLRERGLTSRVELKLPVGRYKVKAVVRENTQGKMGSITKSVEIP